MSKRFPKGLIAGDDPQPFIDKYHFRPRGDGDSTLQQIWEAIQRGAKKRVPSKKAELKAAFQKFKTDNADWKETLLAKRAEKIKEWNQDHGWVNGEPPAEESSSDEDEDGVLTTLPQFMEHHHYGAGARRQHDLTHILVEKPALVGEQSLRPTPARAHAERLLKSREPVDEEIKKKAWEYSAARWAAYRAKVARTGDGRLRGGRMAVCAAGRTSPTERARWTDEAAATLTTLVNSEETTPTKTKAHEPTWERIASTVNSEIAGARYTGKQCQGKAEYLGLLEAELPPPHLYHLDLPAHKVDLDGLPKDVPRGRDARDTFMALPMVSLCWLMGFVYNAYIPKPVEKNRKEVVDALVAAEMCACDPNDHGVELPYLKTPAFTRAFQTKQLQRINADTSNAALERAMGPPSKRRGLHGGPISGRDQAGYARLTMSRILRQFALEFAPRLGEHPPTRFYSEVLEYFTTCNYSKHDDFDADQDCAVCGGLFIDLGGRVFCGYQR